MELVKVKVWLMEFFTAALSFLITFILMSNAGIDVLQTNIFSFDTFSIYVFTLLCICVHFFRKSLAKLIEFISVFMPSNEVKKTKT